MKCTLRRKGAKWFTVVGLLALLALGSVGYGQAAALTDAEKHWLTYMREEEKLARDIYVLLHGLWGSTIFDNISVSEQRHMDAIKSLLDRYGVPDPAAGNAAGVFTNDDLQTLYNDLKDRGRQSLIEALKVGVVIEETDILDLKEGIASTQRKDITKVYSNLLQGSLNHLKAFTSNWQFKGCFMTSHSVIVPFSQDAGAAVIEWSFCVQQGR